MNSNAGAQHDRASRRAVLMSTIGMASIAGCSGGSPKSEKSPTDTATPKPTNSEPPNTDSPTSTPDEEKVPFSEVDRIDEFVSLVEELDTKVLGAERMAGGVSIQYERELPVYDLRSVAFAWAITYQNVTGYTLLSATGVKTDGSRHGLASINEEQTQSFYETHWEHWFGEILTDYDPRWADE